MSMTYEVLKPVGLWYLNGRLAIGEVCPVSHRTLYSAVQCARRRGPTWQVSLRIEPEVL